MDVLVAEVPAAVALAQVAAQGAHVADLRAADVAGRGAQGGEYLLDGGIGGDLGQGRAGADQVSAGGGLVGDRVHALELVDTAQADDLVRLGDVLLLEVMQVGTAGQELGGAPAAVEQSHGLFGRRRPVVGEVLHLSLPSFLGEGSETAVGGKGGVRNAGADGVVDGVADGGTGGDGRGLANADDAAVGHVVHLDGDVRHVLD